jgi:hypothetical protein
MASTPRFVIGRPSVSTSRVRSRRPLAHVGDRTEAAYRRGDLFEKRRRLMDAWVYALNGCNSYRRGIAAEIDVFLPDYQSEPDSAGDGKDAY